MGDFGPIHWVLAAGMMLAIVAAITRAGKRRVSLALRSFDVHRTPLAPGEPLVQIVGRPAGVIAFILTVLQLQPQTRLTVTDSTIEYETASLSGQLCKIVPLPRVSSMAAGVHKPIAYIIVAGFLFLFGCFLSIESRSSIPTVVAMLIAAILLVGYFLSKTVLFEITSNAGIEISLCFHPSVIEGVPVDSAKAIAAAGVIRDLILARSVGQNFGAVLPTLSPAPSDRFRNAVSDTPLSHGPPPPFPYSIPAEVDGAGRTDGEHDEEKAREMLREAIRLYKVGNRDGAITLMNRVIEEFPYTAAATTAESNLTKIRNGVA
jgi:hypothetical protein